MMYENECYVCHGTGLVKDRGECKGTAIVCSYCKGTGGLRKQARRDDVIRVFPGDYGFAHFPDDHTFPDGKVIHYSKFGCTYEDWLNGTEPLFVEELYCPACVTHYCSEADSLRFTDCSRFDKKEECWKKWRENLDKREL